METEVYGGWWMTSKTRIEAVNVEVLTCKMNNLGGELH